VVLHRLSEVRKGRPRVPHVGQHGTLGPTVADLSGDRQRLLEEFEGFPCLPAPLPGRTEVRECAHFRAPVAESAPRRQASLKPADALGGGQAQVGHVHPREREVTAHFRGERVVGVSGERPGGPRLPAVEVRHLKVELIEPSGHAVPTARVEGTYRTEPPGKMPYGTLVRLVFLLPGIDSSGMRIAPLELSHAASLRGRDTRLKTLSADCTHDGRRIVVLDAFGNCTSPQVRKLCVDSAAGTHKPEKSKAVRAYLAVWGHWVRVHYLPAYAPGTNLIERVWWRLHEAVTRNHRSESMLRPRAGTAVRVERGVPTRLA